MASLGFNDTDGNGWLNYPVDWPGLYGADTTTYPLVVIYPLSPEEKRLVGDYLVYQLETTLGLVDWPEGYVGGGFKCSVIMILWYIPFTSKTEFITCQQVC